MQGQDFKSLLREDGQPLDGAPMGALLSAHAQATPDALALSMGAHTLTFREMDEAANRMARRLAAFGVQAGDRVVIAMPNRPEFVQAFFALWKLGAAPAPVSHRMAEEEFAAVVALAAPRCVIGVRNLPKVDAPLFDVDAAHDDVSSAVLPPAIAQPCRYLNTGGSTGRPKLIIDPKPSAWGPDKEGRSRGPRITMMNAGPLYHSGPFAYVSYSMAQGSHIVCMERFDAGEWVAAVEKYKPSYIYLVPTMMSRIAKLPAGITGHADLSSIQTLLHMAAPCPPDVKRWWIERIGPEKILEVYGGSERVGATIITGDEWLLHPGSVGKASAGEDIVIMSEKGEPLPAGEIGEIYFRTRGGAGVNYSYIGADSRISGDLDSFGDLGWLDQDGYLYIADRRTDMIVIGGANVYPAEIEAAIETLDGVLGCAVIGLPDEDMGARLHAIVELSPEVSAPADELSFLAPAMQRLGKLKQPRSVEFTHERIRDDAGKVRRSALRTQRLSMSGA
jgi:bile acid-coenzyme A ligase